MSANLKKKVKGEFVDVGGDLEETFRGDWAEDALVWSEGFDSGVRKPPFSDATSGPGGFTLATASGISGTNNMPGPYTKQILMGFTGNVDTNNRVGLNLDLAQLKLGNLTRVKFWYRKAPSTWSNGANVVLADGIDLVTQNEDVSWEWRQAVGAIPQGADVLTFQVRQAGTFAGEPANRYFAGIELYASADPYMQGHFVTYAGKMWKSLVDNNATQPGSSAQWVEALTLPVKSGTTANRPAAATAGKGYQYYDEDLGQPVWSDGAAWTDAAGVAV